jgi:hypothetical protein
MASLVFVLYSILIQKVLPTQCSVHTSLTLSLTGVGPFDHTPLKMHL